MMDAGTFEKFQDLAGVGERNNAVTLSNLTNDEAFLYKLLKDRIVKNRLEQEKIPQYYVEEQIKHSLRFLL